MAKVTYAQSLRLGPISEQVKRRSSLKQWRKIKHVARRKGYDLESFLDESIPNALKQRTRKGLQRQALSTVEQLYKPVEAELTQREQRVKAIDEKRARDNRYYLDWLQGRSDQMKAASRSADQTLRDTQSQIADDAAVQAGQARAEMMRAGQAMPGNVSDPRQATAFDTSAEDKYNAGLIANERNATNAAIGTQQSRQANLEASNFAMIAASEAKRTADTWSQLADLSDERGRVQLTKAADAAKEVARLLDQEQAKAESNREFKTVAQRLGVDLASIEQRERASKRTARSAADRTAETRRNNRAQLRFEKKKFRFNAGIDNAELAIKQGKLDLDWWKAKHPKGGKDGKGGKTDYEDTPQGRFEYGYALVTSSVRQGKPRKDGTYPNIQYDRDFVANHRNLVENQLVKKIKGLSRREAQTIVQAFLVRGGTDPGKFRDYTPKKYNGPN